MSQRIDLGNLDDLREGSFRTFPELGSHGLIVCRVGGSLYALDDNCSHRDAKLSEGRMRGGLLTCPLHGAQFDVKTGEHQGPPAVTGICSRKVVESDGCAGVDL